MPELPEVESTVRYLRPRLRGEVIKEIRILWPRSCRVFAPLTASSAIEGFRICGISRRGKFIVMKLFSSNGTHRYAWMLVHLRMSGSLDVIKEGYPLAPHDRVVITTISGKTLRFHDVRKFGRIYLTLEKNDVISNLGPEPLSERFTLEEFIALLKGKAGAIKPLLLNQSFIAGIGNIYADEALWRARIHPLTKASRLNRDKAKGLYVSIRRTLLKAIERSGTDNGDGVVEQGMYNPSVYGRAGKRCRRCRSVIRRAVVGQRGTHFCPVCQRF